MPEAAFPKYGKYGEITIMLGLTIHLSRRLDILPAEITQTESIKQDRSDSEKRLHFTPLIRFRVLDVIELQSVIAI